VTLSGTLLRPRELIETRDKEPPDLATIPTFQLLTDTLALQLILAVFTFNVS